MEPLLVKIQFEWMDIVVVMADIAALVDIVVDIVMLRLAIQQHYLDSHLDMDWNIGWDTGLGIDFDTDCIDLDINSKLME